MCALKLSILESPTHVTASEDRLGKESFSQPAEKAASFLQRNLE